MCILCEQGITSPAFHALSGPGFLLADPAAANAPQATVKPSLTYDQAADKIGTTGWADAALTPITYGFRSSDAGDAGFVRFNAALIDASERALELWADVANIRFQRVGAGNTGNAAYTNNATMLFGGDTNDGGYGWAYYPGDRSAGSIDGDVFLNTSGGNFADVSFGSYEFMAIMHEVGHAIGLAHPGAYNGGDPTYALNAEYLQDSKQYTVMSYFEASETGANHGWQYAVTPLLHDIAAAQFLYGANTTTRTGNTVYGFNSNADRVGFRFASAADQKVFAVWDAGGADTFDFSGYSVVQRIDLHQEAFSDVGGLTFNVAIARNAVIENAYGGGADDSVTGNSAANLLRGNGGADRLKGDGGDDTLDGGAGTDTAMLTGRRMDYTFTSQLDGSVVAQDLTSARDGRDTLIGIESVQFSDGTFVLSTLATTGGGGTGGIGSATTRYGTATNDTMNGAGLADTLDGLAGNDVINGGGGNDSLIGGLGNDALNGGDGTDALCGCDGNDTLDGGAGADQLDGGAGNDVIVFDIADTLADGGAGTDTLKIVNAAIPVTFSLAGHNFEAADQVTTDVANNQRWSQIVRHYDANWVFTSEDGTLDAGAGTWHRTQDTAGANPWISTVDYRDGAARLTQRFVANDDGTRYVSTYDTGALSWTDITDYFSGQNLLTQRSVRNDDGTRYTSYYDTNNAGGLAWSAVTDNFNAAGTLLQRNTINDDGTRTTTYFDFVGIETWNSILDTLDSAQRLMTRQTFNDDGSHLASYFDVDNTATWSSFTQTYNAANVLIHTCGVDDNGVTWQY